MVWTKGGIQHVWGLGIPVWRLPFEGLARLLGQPGFPDRIIFGVAFALVTYAILRIFAHRRSSIGEVVHSVRSAPENACAVLLLILFPPFLTVDKLDATDRRLDQAFPDEEVSP